MSFSSPWPTARLASLTTRIGSGITPRGGAAVYRASGRPFVRSQNVGWGRLRLRDLAFIDEPSHATFRASEIRAGDVLLNITGASIGRCAVATEQIVGGNVNQHVCEIRLDQRKVDPTFVAAVLISRLGQDQIDSFQAGGNREGLNFGHVGSIVVPVPALPEQQTIAAALTDAGALIAGLEQAIEKRTNMKRAIMQELLTGRSRLAGFRGDWMEVRVGSIGATYGGLTGKTKDDFGAGQALYVPFMAVMARTRVESDSLLPVRVAPRERQNAVRPGDLLFNTSSETPDELAMCAVAGDMPINTYLNSFCFGFRLNDVTAVDPLFLAYAFRSDVGRSKIFALAQGATRYNLSKSQFRELWLSLPDVREQRAIASVLRDVDADIDAVRMQLRKADDVEQGMMQELLRGRTRLAVEGREAVAA